MSVVPPPSDDLGPVLLARARAAIAVQLGVPAAAVPACPAALERPGATFVTLTQAGALRGCVGTLEPERSLGQDVQHNALGAAFRDPRFAPLRVAELPRTAIEVSLLSPLEPLAARDEESLLASLRPGRDGLVLGFAGRRATFLPQVWDMLGVPREFVAALKRKAGLPGDFWHARIEVARYGVTKWSESPDPREAR